MPTRHPSQEQITEALLAFINAQTWADSRQIVEARRDVLLTDAVEQFIATLLEQYQGDEEATEVLQEHRGLLARCRHQGIDTAFADRLHAREMQDIPQHLMLLPALQHMATQVQASQGSPVSRSLPDELYALLQELLSPLRLSDMPHRIQLCQAALALVDRAQQPELWAALQLEFGNSLAQNPQEEQANNLETAIVHYQQALTVYTRERPF
jgi:hypothetical protein